MVGEVAGRDHHCAITDRTHLGQRGSLGDGRRRSDRTRPEGDPCDRSARRQSDRRCCCGSCRCDWIPVDLSARSLDSHGVGGRPQPTDRELRRGRRRRVVLHLSRSERGDDLTRHHPRCTTEIIDRATYRAGHGKHCVGGEYRTCSHSDRFCGRSRRLVGVPTAGDRCCCGIPRLDLGRIKESKAIHTGSQSCDAIRAIGSRCRLRGVGKLRTVAPTGRKNIVHRQHADTHRRQAPAGDSSGDRSSLREHRVDVRDPLTVGHSDEIRFGGVRLLEGGTHIQWTAVPDLTEQISRLTPCRVEPQLPGTRGDLQAVGTILRSHHRPDGVDAAEWVVPRPADLLSLYCNPRRRAGRSTHDSGDGGLSRQHR